MLPILMQAQKTQGNGALDACLPYDLTGRAELAQVM